MSDGLDTVACWRCGRQRPTFESCPHCGGSCKPLGRKKQTREQPDRSEPGFFELPENCNDLFDLFLSPPIRQARQEAIQEIEQQGTPEPIQTAAKALVTIQSINAEAKLSQQERQQLRRNKRGGRR